MSAQLGFCMLGHPGTPENRRNRPLEFWRVLPATWPIALRDGITEWAQFLFQGGGRPELRGRRGTFWWYRRGVVFLYALGVRCLRCCRALVSGLVRQRLWHHLDHGCFRVQLYRTQGTMAEHGVVWSHLLNATRRGGCGGVFPSLNWAVRDRDVMYLLLGVAVDKRERVPRDARGPRPEHEASFAPAVCRCRPR